MCAYVITFPIWKGQQWSAFRGHIRLSNEQVLIARFNDTASIEQELRFLEQHQRVKSKIEGKFIKPVYNLLPMIVQVIKTPTFTDVLFDNCVDWQLTGGNLQHLLRIYFAYDIYKGQPPRDCTLENIMRNGDSIVVLDFGLRKRVENYCAYWNPMILKGKQCLSQYQWSLGIMYLVMTNGSFIINEINKRISIWLNGGKLDLVSLVTVKKQSIISLIQQLLNPENPIPWEQIPHHSAFRDDPKCKAILKLYEVRSMSDLKIRPVSRLSNKQSSRKTQRNSLVLHESTSNSNQSTSNQSLISKISSLYKNKFIEEYKQRCNSSVKNNKQINNFFSNNKMKLKFATKQSDNTVQLSCDFRSLRTGSNLSNFGLTQRIDDSDDKKLNRRLSQQEIEYDKIRSRVSSIRMAIKNYKARSLRHLSQDSNVPVQNSEEISHPDNYIQLIKRPQVEIEILTQNYLRSLECINIIGQTVAKSIEFLDALQNFWIIPLFLVFKRMLQLRLEVEKFLEAQINSFNIGQWKEVCNSREYLQFLTRIKSDNYLVRNEMILLMNASHTKADQLDKTKREKVLWFLNDNLDSNIQPICLSYMKDQLLLAIIEKRGLQREPIEWLKLQLSLKASIIITQLPVLVCENNEFSYERYLQYQDSQNYAQIQKYCEQLKIII
ncbi:unnamed protein product [Paramecium pentaurelia]|uniref:Protein kinase domain-containing protein n=1 Tax=Paramecium pentaurelia TaxID=43138 RepID=A0A8S1SZ96_9CILI|nr:unnamed protein product [Paramecium pentaurelia]